jgi:signal transduction histidine kinase
LGHRRDHRVLTRGTYLLAGIVVLLALVLGGVKLHFQGRVSSIEQQWDEGLRDDILERAVAGVRAAFGDTVALARDCAAEVAAEIEDQDLPSRPEGASAEQLFTTLFEIPRPDGISGLLILDRDGRELAWDGRIQAPSRDLLDATEAGEPFAGVLTSELHRTIITVAVPIRGKAGFAGAAVAFRPFDVTFPLRNRYLPRIPMEEDLARRWSVASVLITAPAEARPYESRVGDTVTTSLALDDDRVVAGLEITSDSLDGHLAKLREREDAWTAALGAALALAMIVLLFWLGRRLRLLPGPARAVGGILLLVGLRIVLRWAGFPQAVGPDVLLDPSDFATTYMGNLLGNPGEILLTAVTLAGMAVLAVRAAVVILRGDRRARLPVLAALAIAGLTAIFYLWSGFHFVVVSMVFDSTLDYVSPQTIWPSGPLLAMVVTLFFLTGSLLLAGVVALVPSARLLARVPRLPVALRWVVVTVVLAPVLAQAAEAERIWLPWAAATILAITGWLVDVGRVRSYATFLGLSVLPGTVLAFATLAPIVADEVQSDLRSEVRATLRESMAGSESTLEQFLMRTEGNPSVRSALSRGASEAPGLAFRLWALSSLSRRGIDCDIEVRNVEGQAISRWEIRMPPASWLPHPPRSPSEPRPWQRREHGSGGASDQWFLVASHPVFGDEERFLGTVLVRLREQSHATWGRAAPEILRNVAAEETAADPAEKHVNWYRGDRLIESTDSQAPRAIRAPLEVAQALLLGDEEEVWIEDDREDGSWLILFVPWSPSGDPEAEPGMLAASLRLPGLLETLRFFLKLLLVSSIVALALYAGHLLLRLRRIQFRFQHKLLLSYLILSALPVAMLARVNTDLAEERFRETLEDRLHETLSGLSRKLSEGGENALASSLPDLLDETSSIAPLSSEWCKKEGWRLNRDINIYVVSRLRASSEPGVFRTELFPDRLSGRAFLEVVLGRRELFTHRERAGEYSFLTGYAPLKDPANGEVIGAIGVPMFWRQGALDRELARRNTSLLATYLLTLILVVFIGIFLSRRISSPIESLAEATDKLGQGDLTYRIPRSTRDELGDLVDSFNRMAQDIASGRDQVVRAEKDAAWREMARQVAHEIKNPLTPMKLAAQQILRAWDDQHPDMDRIVHRAGETIVRQVENLRLIASDFGDFARISVGEVRLISINETVRDALALYAGLAERGIRIEEDTATDLPPVRADAEGLQRMLINLLQNSVQALEPGGGGLITVRTRPTTVRFEGEDLAFVEIAVIDDGPGIPTANRDRVFEPNFSTKSGGTGLGLAICRQIVESLRGEIHVESADGNGTTVRVHLPACEDAKTG